MARTSSSSSKGLRKKSAAPRCIAAERSESSSRAVTRITRDPGEICAYDGLNFESTKIRQGEIQNDQWNVMDTRIGDELLTAFKAAHLPALEGQQP